MQSLQRLQKVPATAVLSVLLVVVCQSRANCGQSPAGPSNNEPLSAQGVFQYSFAIAADMRNFATAPPGKKHYFDGACQALRSYGAGEFMLSPGDCDPPGPVREVIDRYLGTNYIWYPVAGNHDTEKQGNMSWLRSWAKGGIPFVVRQGPRGAEETTYSFEFGNSHVVMLNEYYNGKSDAVRGKDDLPDATLDWLEQDLSATRQPLIWVVGHKPIKSMPDMDNGKVRHGRESVSTNREHFTRFINLLKEHKVRAYICGHTHCTSVTRIHGLWQLDSGHARGGGDASTPSTFMKIRVQDTRTWVDVFRSDTTGILYLKRLTCELES